MTPEQIKLIVDLSFLSIMIGILIAGFLHAKKRKAEEKSFAREEQAKVDNLREAQRNYRPNATRYNI